MPTMPAALTYGYVTGQYLLAVADSSRDDDHLPDPIAATGTVRFKPTTAAIRSAGGLSPVVVPQTINAGIDDQGFLVDPTGARGVWLVAGSYDVSFQLGAVALAPFRIFVGTEHTEASPLDLGAETPFVPAPGEVFVVNEAVRAATFAARDEAVAAAASITIPTDAQIAALASSGGSQTDTALDIRESVVRLDLIDFATAKDATVLATATALTVAERVDRVAAITTEQSARVAALTTEQLAREAAIATAKTESASSAAGLYFLRAGTVRLSEHAGNLTAAIAALPAADGTLVIDGSYDVTPASGYTSTRAISKPRTRVTGPGKLALAAGAPAGSRLLAITGPGITVEGVTFDARGITDATSLYLDGATDLTIRGNTFLNPASGGVHITNNVTNLSITGNIFRGPRYGILTNNPTGGGRWKIANNDFDGQGQAGDGIELNCPLTGLANVSITGNIVRGYARAADGHMGFGIGIARATDLVVTGNVVENCGRSGIHIEDVANRTGITGNTVKGCGDAGIEVQPIASGIIEDVVITGNVVTGNCVNPTTSPTGLGLGGIQVGWADAAVSNFSVRRIIITGNVVKGNLAAGIYTFQASDSVVTGNDVADNIGPGILLRSPTSGVCLGNRSYDTRTAGSKTQTYGLSLVGGCTGLVVGINALAGNSTGERDHSTGSQTQLEFSPVGLDGWRIGGSAAKLGFFGAPPVGLAAVASQATDAATTQALVNDLRVKLLALGLVKA
jgi:parallel beta-helix repeat protein